MAAERRARQFVTQRHKFFSLGTQALPPLIRGPLLHAHAQNIIVSSSPPGPPPPPTHTHTHIASYPGLLPPPRAHAPYVLIMRRWFFGGRRPGRFHHVMRATTLRRMTFSYSRYPFYSMGVVSHYCRVWGY